MNQLNCFTATEADLEAFKFEVETKLKGSGSEIRRGMIAAADELDDLKRRHAREIQDLRLENARKDRELEEGRTALRELGDDLARERDTVRAHKVCQFVLIVRGNALH